jgi:hypothetical protein
VNVGPEGAREQRALGCCERLQAFVESGPFVRGEHHWMNGRRADAKALLQINFGARPSEHVRIIRIQFQRVCLRAYLFGQFIMFFVINIASVLVICTKIAWHTCVSRRVLAVRMTEGHSRRASFGCGRTSVFFIEAKQ